MNELIALLYDAVVFVVYPFDPDAKDCPVLVTVNKTQENYFIYERAKEI